MHGLLTDLYELTMAAGYFQAGKTAERATFELSARRLPANRSYILAAGLEQAIDYLRDLSFTARQIDYLRALPGFSRAPAAFFEYLRDFRFTGDVWAAEEGTPLFAGEPLLRVSAPIIEAQIPETYLLATLTFQSLIATKASRIVAAAEGRPVVEFGTRRAHTPQAGTLGARAAYLAGCVGTSNVEAGHRFGIPVYGTAAHSWTMSYDSEPEAFAHLEALLGPLTVYLVDTYDVPAGVQNAIAVGRPFWGIRLDSGDFLTDSRAARRAFDHAGYPEARIMASGDLNEARIAELVSAGAPIDWFGVGTELATSCDAPAMGSVYKLVEIEREGRVRPAAKFSRGKPSLPGAKQIFRFPDHDVLGLAGESLPGATPLLEPVVRAGARIAPQPDLAPLRERSRQKLAAIPEACRRLENPSAYPVILSGRLRALAAEVRKSELKEVAEG
ncbi:MAG TPA: nicotinate phosphoribosyltransferase [Bryobacterales bacterium]|nr:nicotinate phosphoribosyltransferase [Bryobacterales bacterium]